MNQKITYLIALAFFLQFLTTIPAFAQDQPSKFGISFSGFVRADLIYDTRQNAESREGFFIFYPLAPDYDPSGKDINASPSFNQYAMVSRLSGKITGPDAFGAKTSGLIEGDFTGPSNMVNNGFRLRHAYVKLSWKKTQLLTGQYWSPLDVIEVVPRVLSLNTGAPFHSFSRNPQIRFSWKALSNMNLIAVAYTQRDFSSIGMNGRSAEYIRYSSLPNMHFQLQYSPGTHLMGFGVDYKTLKPALETDKGYKTDETIGSMAAVGFIKLSFKKVICRFEAVWGQNLNDHLMMGGFYADTYDSITGAMTYKNASQLSFWTDIESRGEHFNAGIFIGYAKNLDLPYLAANNTMYLLGQDIEALYRISPRLTYKSGSISLLAESEITSARYRFFPNAQTAKQEIQTVTNLRLHMAIVYNF